MTVLASFWKESSRFAPAVMRGPVLPQYQAAIHSSFATDAEGAGHPVLPAFVCARKGSGSEGSDNSSGASRDQHRVVAGTISWFQVPSAGAVRNAVLGVRLGRCGVPADPAAAAVHRPRQSGLRRPADSRRPPLPSLVTAHGPSQPRSTTIRDERIFLKPFARASSVLERIAVHQVSGLQLMHCLLAC